MNPLRSVSLLALASLALSAHAAFTLTLSDPVRTAAPGDALSFAGILTNTGPDAVYLQGALFLAPGLNLDPSPYNDNHPALLNAGESYTGAFFNVNVPATAVPGSYGGGFSVLGGASSDPFDPFTTTASDGFTVVVNPVPEPATLAALGLGAGALLRRRKRA